MDDLFDLLHPGEDGAEGEELGTRGGGTTIIAKVVFPDPGGPHKIMEGR